MTSRRRRTSCEWMRRTWAFYGHVVTMGIGCGSLAGAAFRITPVPRQQLSSQWSTENSASQLWLFRSDKSLDIEYTSSSSFTISEPEPPRPHRVTFASPLLDYGYPRAVEEYQNESISEKPILLYLPGFDGTYICPFIQYPELGTEFDVWCMSVGVGDRSSFDELKMCVLDFIEMLAKGDDESSRDSANISKEQQPRGPRRQGEEVPVETNENLSSRKFETEQPQPFWSSWFSPEKMKPSPLKKGKRSIYLAGESFGGILAAEVALTLLNETYKKDSSIDLQGLVLINPATCYDRSQLAAKGPPVAKLPSMLYPFGLLGLLPLFTDEYSIEQLLLILGAKVLPSVIDNPVREAFMGRVAFSLPFKLEYMDQATLTWRLEEWLTVGCARMESRIRDFERHPSFRTLVLVGEKDLTLPSIAEAERLVNLLPKCQVHVVEGAGHASTCGSRVDMTAQFRSMFAELVRKNKNIIPSQSSSNNNGKTTDESSNKRTAMKSVAAQGTGPYFGMEPRYDGANIGLNPILYWSKENFRPTKTMAQEHTITVSEKSHPTVYTKISYRVK